MIFPPLHWWAALLEAPQAGISLYEGPPDWRFPPNRYHIATANGGQTLSIPLQGGRRQRLPLGELHIDYLHDWQRQHWGALYSAYGRAPFFEHYGEALKSIVYSSASTLDALCRMSIDWLARELRLPLSFKEGTSQMPLEWQKPEPALPEYHQVFESKWGFIPNLSAIDLLMNEGPYGAALLKME